MTSNELRTQHQVLFRAPIIRDGGWRTGNDEAVWTVGGGDVIDLDHSGRAEYHHEPAGFLRTNMVYDEPVIVGGMKRLRAFASEQGTEVLTAQEAPQVKVAEVGVSIGGTIFQEDEILQRHTRPLDSLVVELYPRDRDAQWAVDLTQNEFLIWK